ncbi:sugar phosphate isomerase/epimerase [Phyllobacterium sp. SB3]|uniref:sugar phosphate isomerase/epimerase family protein n=1 Tax=Phyllobacterium sp. SB3 TaxID=3156073 RepID=UPI0032AED982
MKLGIFAKTFPGTSPLDVLRAAAEAGYSSVQYNMACSGIGALPEHVSPQVVQAIKSASEETGVEIAAISATYNMIHPDVALREAGRRSFEAIAAASNAIGSRLLTVCTGSRDPLDQWRHHPDNQGESAWTDMLLEFQAQLVIAERFDVLVGVEPELGNVVNSARRARTLIDTAGSDRIRIVFDPANLFETEEAPTRRLIVENAIDLLKDRIEIAHAKDRNADGNFATAGKGVLDYGHYLAALEKAGFEGSLITHGLASGEAEGVAVFLKTTLSKGG